MNAPTRKFSTVLPSVASLRTKFEKPGQPPPPLLRVPSASGGLLKTASSQTALLKTSASRSQDLKAPEPGSDAKINANANGVTSAEPPPLVIKTKLEPLEESANEVKSPVTPLAPAQSVPSDSRRPSTVEASRRASVTTGQSPKPPTISPETTRRVSLIAEPNQKSPAVSPDNNTRRVSITPDRPTSIDQRKGSIIGPPPTVAPPQPPEGPPPIPASRTVVSTPTTTSQDASGTPAKESETLSTFPQLKNEGILYCVHGYGSGLDAMRTLRKELQMNLGREGFLDPTTCRSVGMQSFLDNSEAVFAFLEGATVSATVRYQIARGLFLGKKIVIFSDEHQTTPRSVELVEQLAEMMANSSEDSLGKSKDEWRSMLSSALIQFVSSPQSEERRILTLVPIEKLLTGANRVYGSRRVPLPDLLTGTCAFMISGFDADAMAQAEIEFSTRGYPAAVSETVIRAIVGVFFLPGVFDEKQDDYNDRRSALETSIRECRGRGMTVIGVSSRFPSSWVPSELEGLVFPSSAAFEDIIRACDVPAIALKTQGDTLEPMRIIAEKARRFSSESGRDAVLADILLGKDKITVLSAPSGWGKTTTLAELCRRHSRVVASLSRAPLDQSETVGALFFFSRLDPSRSNHAANCLRSISRQLSGTIPGFVLDEAAQDVLDDPSASVTSLLETLIVQPATQLSSKGRPPSRRVLIVVDALDECEDYEQLQVALNSKWQSVPNWLALICSTQVRPQIVARHIEATNEKHLHKYLDHLLGSVWLVPDVHENVAKLDAISQGSFLWITICEPIIVNACETAALAQASAYLPYFESVLPSEPGLPCAVKHVFDRFTEFENNSEKVRQAYSLAVCAPRSFLPVEIYSYCGVETIPPLLVIEDLCVKPLHAAVMDALKSECGVQLDTTKDHALISDALEKAYSSGSLTTPLAKRFAAAHASMHARLTGKQIEAKAWFEEFSRLFDVVAQCVKETGDALRAVQDGEDCGVSDEIMDVVRLASPAVSFDVREFPGQIIGRLPAGHPLALRGAEFAKKILVNELKSMVALPNPHFSGLTPARGPLRKVIRHRSPVLGAVEINGFVLTCSGPVGFVWNVARSEKLLILKGHTEDIRCCAFNCTPQAGDSWSFTAITGSADHSARLWQGSFRSSQPTAVVSCTRTFSGGHDSAITCLSYRHADNFQEAFLCTGSADKTIIIWDLSNGQQKTRLIGHSGEVRSVCVSDDSKLISGSHDKTCRIWDLSSSKEVAKLEGHTRDVSAVALTTERYYTASFDGIARAFDRKSLKLVQEFRGHTQRINSMCVSPDGTRLATASYDGTARIFDAASGSTLLVLKGHMNDVACVRFCADPTRLVTTSLDCEVRFWSSAPDIVQRFQTLASRHHEQQVTCTFVGKEYACTGCADGTARVWNLVTGAMLAELKQDQSEESLCGVAVSNDGTVVVTAADDGQIVIWDVTSQSKPRFIISDVHRDAIEEVSISEDIQYARTITYDREMFVWDLSTGRTVTAGSIVPMFPLQPVSRKQDSRHVLGPTGSSVGLTLDSAQFAVALDTFDESILPRTFGEIGDMFYLWEWHSPT